MTDKTMFVGAPVDIGADVFMKLCMPIACDAFRRLNATPREMGQLYAGFISAALGAMVADVGREQALAWAQQTLDMVASGDIEDVKAKAKH